jgi:hypothetical protein
VFENWFDRAFYLTRLQDIPPLHQLVNHIHAKDGDREFDGEAVRAGDTRDRWVLARSIGRFRDPEFAADGGTLSPEEIRREAEHATPPKFNGNYQVVDGTEGFGSGPTKYDAMDNIVQQTIRPPYVGEVGVGTPLRTPHGTYTDREPLGGTTPARHKGLRPAQQRPISGVNVYRERSSTVPLGRRPDAMPGVADHVNEILGTIVLRPSFVDINFFTLYNSDLHLKLLQVGYQTLSCIREFLAKLPNIYITTEWADDTIGLNDQNFDINNDLYVQGIILWVIPTDTYGTESLRWYPVHAEDHELPLCAGISLKNEQAQGNTIYTWDILNVVNPAQMSLNPLIENMGLISFSPTLTANTLPLAYYDSNISGFLKGKFMKPQENLSYCVNCNQGYIRVITIGINGVASVNLNLYRLVF